MLAWGSVSMQGCEEWRRTYGVVLILHALAFPQVALGRVVVGLAPDGLRQALDVAVDVAAHLVVGLHAAGGLEDWTGLAGLGGDEVAVGFGEGGHGCRGEDGCGDLHFDEVGWVI